jgi:arylsulfatase A-like enzyme
MKHTIIDKFRTRKLWIELLAGVAALTAVSSQASAQQQKRPNVVMLMTDDTGWNDFGAYSGGGAALGHATPNIDRIAKEGAMFTNWYGQASCTAGRASFMTGRIPIRSALSIVVAPGDENALRKETPTIAEFFQKNAYSTYFSGKWHLGDKPTAYPIELDDDIGRVMDAIRAEAPNTIVIVTADNGAWQDAYPDAGTTPFRGEKGTAFEGGWRVPGLMWWTGHIPAGAKYDEMMSHIDCWSTLAKMVGLTPPPHGAWTDNNGKPIYFDSIDNSAYILGQAKHSARRSWVYIDGENFMGARQDVSGDPSNPDLNITWKYLWTAKDTWLGSEQNLGAIGALYNLTMDPFEKYDMVFNGAASARLAQSSPGRYAGQDNGWVLALIFPVVMEFNKSIADYPSIKRSPGGASNDWRPNLQDPDNPVPLLDMKNPPHIKGGGG